MSEQMDGKVVVITGASSGIGKATALAFARRGASLALCARREAELEDTARLCREAGAKVVSAQVDVSEEKQVQALARRAIEAFGHIDVWFNNAGIDTFGDFTQIPTAAFERVIQVNLMGTVHGSRAAVVHFRERGAGVLINCASIVGTCPSPYHSPYVASKFAIRGFSHALRQEVADAPNIHVCTVCPSSIDTPLWQRSGNYSGRRVKPLDPVHPPEQVADVVVQLALAPQREVFAGATGWVLAEQHAAAPELTENFVGAFARRDLFQDVPAAPSEGAIFEAGKGEGGVEGGWMRPGRPGIPVADLPALFAGPALLAAGPGLFSWTIACGFARQFGMQAVSPQAVGAMFDRITSPERG